MEKCVSQSSSYLSSNVKKIVCFQVQPNVQNECCENIFLGCGVLNWKVIEKACCLDKCKCLHFSIVQINLDILIFALHNLFALKLIQFDCDCMCPHPLHSSRIHTRFIPVLSLSFIHFIVYSFDRFF